MNTDFIQVTKSGVEHYFVPSDTATDNFITKVFVDWENDTFRIFETCKDRNGIAIDLGAWIGTTSIWLSKNFKHVLAVESDVVSLQYLKKNLKASNCDNVTICDKPIHNKSEIITFGPRGEKLNESISYIKEMKDNFNDYTLKSITLKQLIYEYIHQNKDISDARIAFIKCDIEGGEENILEDILYFAYYQNVKVYLSFHPQFYQNHTISDFRYLFDFFEMSTADGPVSNIETYLSTYPFGSVLFESTYNETGRTLVKKICRYL